MFSPVSISAAKNIDRDHSADAASDTIQLRNAPARAKADSVA
jgi:hypothetical protein